MKKIFFLLLFTIASYGQAVFDEGIQITNTESTTATKVNVQETNGEVNYILKSDLIDVIESNSAINLPVVGVVGKIYITKDNNKIYRWNGTFYQEISADVTTATIQAKRPLKTIETQSLEGSGNIDLNKSDVGLGNVDNTSDVSKPVSTAQQTALNLKANDSDVLHKTGNIPEDISGIKSINNSTQPYTSSFIFSNSFNGGIETHANAPFRIINSLNGIGGHILNEGSGVGLFFNNTSSGTLAYLDRNLDSTGDFISWQIDKVNVGKIDYLGNFFTSGKLTWGEGVFNMGDSQIYNTATAGTQLVGKTGSLSDFQLINGLGQGVYSVPTGTRNVVFDNNIYASRFTGGATLTGTPTAPTAAAGTNTTQIATTAFVQANARPYKVYTAFYTQQGTANPSFTVLENTIGSVSWSRTGTGTFVATSSNLFTLNKTFITTLSGTTNFIINASTFSSSDVWLNFLSLTTGNLTDGINTNKNFVEIRVYN